MTWETGQETIAHLLRRGCDLYFDLGDSAFSERAYSEQQAVEQYLVYRTALGELPNTGATFMVIGNHEGEAGFYQFGSG